MAGWRTESGPRNTLRSSTWARVPGPDYSRVIVRRPEVTARMMPSPTTISAAIAIQAADSREGAGLPQREAGADHEHEIADQVEMDEPHTRPTAADSPRARRGG